MSKTRKESLKIINDFYQFSYVDDRLKCVYCDMGRECIDHMPPLSQVRKFGVSRVKKENITLHLVPSCKACNTALGARPLWNYSDRLNYLYSHYTRKLESHALWGDDEIEELSGHLKQMIKAKQKHLRDEIVARIRAIECNLIQAETREAKLEGCGIGLS